MQPVGGSRVRPGSPLFCGLGSARAFDALVERRLSLVSRAPSGLSILRSTRVFSKALIESCFDAWLDNEIRALFDWLFQKLFHTRSCATKCKACEQAKGPFAGFL